MQNTAHAKYLRAVDPATNITDYMRLVSELVSGSTTPARDTYSRLLRAAVQQDSLERVSVLLNMGARVDMGVSIDGSSLFDHAKSHGVLYALIQKAIASHLLSNTSGDALYRSNMARINVSGPICTEPPETHIIKDRPDTLYNKTLPDTRPESLPVISYEQYAHSTELANVKAQRDRFRTALIAANAEISELRQDVAGYCDILLRLIESNKPK